MYKFEISADSPEELAEKMGDFARSYGTKVDMIPRQPDLPVMIDDVDDIEEPEQAVTLPQAAPLRAPLNIVNNLPPAPSHPGIDQTGLTQEVAARMAGQMTDKDKNGFPWDNRIHASSKSFNKDGTWRYKRGVDEPTIKQVEDELRGVASSPNQHQGGVAAPVAPPPPAPTVAVEMPTFQDRNKETPWTNTIPPAATPVQQPPQQSYQNVQVPAGNRPAYNLASFKNNLMTLLAQLINEGKIDQNYIEQMKQYFGVKEIWNVLGSEAQVIEMYNSFGEYGFITKMD